MEGYGVPRNVARHFRDNAGTYEGFWLKRKMYPLPQWR